MASAIEPDNMGGEGGAVPGTAIELLGRMSLERAPAEVIADAERSAKALTDILAKKPDPVMMNGHRYLEFEDWQTVARFYGVTARLEGTPEYVEFFGDVRGFRAEAVAVSRDGEIVSRASAYCLTDEEKWRSRPKYEWHYVLKDGTTSLEDPGVDSMEWEDNPNKPGKRRPVRRRVLAGEESVPLFQIASMAQCVPLDAEILTRRGFKRHDELLIGEEVLAYDLAIDSCSWTALEAVNVFGPDKPMISIRSRSLDVRCTADHSWAVREIHGARRSRVDYRLLPVDGIRLRDSIVIAAKAEGGNLPVTEDEARLMGWLITDGSLRVESSGRFRGHIDQANPRYVSEVRALVGNLAVETVSVPNPEHLTPGGKPWGIRDCYRWSLPTGVVTRLMERFGAKSKADLPGCVTHLSAPARRAMLEAMLHADGHEIRGSGIWRFAKNDPATFSTFQVLCALEGIACGRQHERDDVRFCQVTRRHRVLVRNSLRIEPAAMAPTWCPTTGLGTWVMRQNGQVMITGNTRACAKALRNVFAWVAVLAGVKPTPAEELTGGEPSVRRSAPPKGESKRTTETTERKADPAMKPTPEKRTVSKAEADYLFRLADLAGFEIKRDKDDHAWIRITEEMAKTMKSGMSIQLRTLTATSFDRLVRLVEEYVDERRGTAAGPPSGPMAPTTDSPRPTRMDVRESATPENAVPQPSLPGMEARK